ncbi:hypothetical protein MUP38_07875 [Candidatus Bathyarchaeota archaeon]|nr:hypothetical protein [Candidatus Bathyarchaeota archaeon]
MVAAGPEADNWTMFHHDLTHKRVLNIDSPKHKPNPVELRNWRLGGVITCCG